MPQGLEIGAIGADTSVDPLILLLVLCAFLIGAVGPFVLCVVGSLREERSMRDYAADHAVREGASTLLSPVHDAAVPAIAPLVLGAVVDGEPANDHHVKTIAAVAGR
ncbi:MAG: hypothetical protein HQ481_09720 [Alphaproteobacteria bacterium]|nr:hypothetical protein [Alphaproteobacteria bacterium]